MAPAALIVAIVSALFAGGALVQSIRAFRRSGWALEVSVYWNDHDRFAAVEIINTGRQTCLISEIEYVFKALREAGNQEFPKRIFRDEGPFDPIEPSAKMKTYKSFAKPSTSYDRLPSSFTLQVRAWTAGRPHKSGRDRWDRRRRRVRYRSFLASLFEDLFG